MTESEALRTAIQELATLSGAAWQNYRCTILLVDDEPAVLAVLAKQLSDEFDIQTACSIEQARGMLAKQPIDIVLTDLQLEDGSGISLLEWVKANAPQTARILLSGTARVEDAADAVNRALVHRLLLKPWRAVDLLENVRGVARSLLLERSHRRLLDDYRKLNQELEDRVAARTAELGQALQQLELKNQFLEKMALTDVLTGMPNRRAIELITRKELLRRTRSPSPIAMALVDVDNFKMVNSRYLLCGGDHVLKHLGRILQTTIRGSDSVGRIGGEEFLVVAPYTEAMGAAALGERLRIAVEQHPAIYQGQQIQITVSVGVASAESGAVHGYEQMRELAAAALAEAKANGRNRCVVRLLKADEQPMPKTRENFSATS